MSTNSYDFLTEGTPLPSSVFTNITSPGHTGYNNLSRSGILSEFIANPGTGLARNSLGLGANTGGFFGNGNGFGLNLDTANFAMNGATGIMNLYGAYTQAQAIKAAQRNIEKQVELSMGAYDMNIDKKARAAANFNGYGVAGMDAAGTNALNRWGTKAILGKTNLSPATSATAAARRTQDEPVTA